MKTLQLIIVVVTNFNVNNDDVVEQCWNGHGTEKKKNQKEQDRLFWETCLAS